MGLQHLLQGAALCDGGRRQGEVQVIALLVVGHQAQGTLHDLARSQLQGLHEHAAQLEPAHGHTPRERPAATQWQAPAMCCLWEEQLSARTALACQLAWCHVPGLQPCTSRRHLQQQGATCHLQAQICMHGSACTDLHARSSSCQAGSPVGDGVPWRSGQPALAGGAHEGDVKPAGDAVHVAVARCARAPSVAACQPGRLLRRCQGLATQAWPRSGAVCDTSTAIKAAHMQRSWVWPHWQHQPACAWHCAALPSAHNEQVMPAPPCSPACGQCTCRAGLGPHRQTASKGW